MSELMNATLRARRSSLAITRTAPVFRHRERASLRTGRSLSLPLSTSVYSSKSAPPTDEMCWSTADLWASRPRPLRPCLPVDTLK